MHKRTIPYQYMITIRRKQRLLKVTRIELIQELYRFKDLLPKAMIFDIGIHGNCKYFQLHLHAIIFSNRSIFYKNHSNTIWFIKITKITQTLHKVIHYIHADDHNNMFKLQQLLIENDYYYATPA